MISSAQSLHNFHFSKINKEILWLAILIEIDMGNRKMLLIFCLFKKLLVTCYASLYIFWNLWLLSIILIFNHNIRNGGIIGFIKSHWLRELHCCRSSQVSIQKILNYLFQSGIFLKFTYVERNVLRNKFLTKLIKTKFLKFNF